VANAASQPYVLTNPLLKPLLFRLERPDHLARVGLNESARMINRFQNNPATNCRCCTPRRERDFSPLPALAKPTRPSGDIFAVSDS